MPTYKIDPPDDHTYFCHPLGPNPPHMDEGDFACLANRAFAVVRFHDEIRQDDWSDEGQAVVCTLYAAVVQCVFPTQLTVGVVTTKDFYEANPLIGKIAKVVGAYVPMALPEPGRLINTLMLDDCVPLVKSSAGWVPERKPKTHQSEVEASYRLQEWRNLMEKRGDIETP